MMTLDYNSNGDVVAYADVQLFRSYITAALDYGVLQHELMGRRQRFSYGLTILMRAHWSQ